MGSCDGDAFGGSHLRDIDDKESLPLDLLDALDVRYEVVDRSLFWEDL